MTATYNALENGLDETGNSISVRPEGVESMLDWIKPGGQHEREKIIRILLEHKVDPNDKDYHDYTPLHYAIILGWLEVVKLLVEHGADINVMYFIQLIGFYCFYCYLSFHLSNYQ